jgi:hypothetical protein
MEFLITLANLFYLSGYLVRSMLALRVLALGGAATLAVYFATRPEPLITAVYWNLFYVAMNLTWIARLLAGAGPRREDPAGDA